MSKLVDKEVVACSVGIFEQRWGSTTLLMPRRVYGERPDYRSSASSSHIKLTRLKLWYSYAFGLKTLN